jgi:hypothetical protein
MIDKEIIIKNERENDGQTIFLYYDDIAGMYMAFGQSAYYATMVTDPYMSYSEAMQMPVALLRREHVLSLRQSLNRVDHAVRSYYRFSLRENVGKAGYERWANGIITRHGQIAKYT